MLLISTRQVKENTYSVRRQYGFVECVCDGSVVEEKVKGSEEFELNSEMEGEMVKRNCEVHMWKVKKN